MTTPRIKRRLLSSLAVTAAAVLTFGLAAPTASADTSTDNDVEVHVSNAEMADPLCDIPPEHDPAVNQEVYDIAVERGVTDKVMLSMFMAGWVESHMHNLDCGDRDSLGVFQQRPSQGWCDPASLCMDVNHATNAYLDQAIPNEQSNPGFTAGELAQSVQRSAYPDRYDEAHDKAQELWDEAAG